MFHLARGWQSLSGRYSTDSDERQALAPDEVCVLALQGQQLFVRPLLDDPPLLQDDNLVRTLHRAEPMRDHQHCGQVREGCSWTSWSFQTSAVS